MGCTETPFAKASLPAPGSPNTDGAPCCMRRGLSKCRSASCLATKNNAYCVKCSLIWALRMKWQDWKQNPPFLRYLLKRKQREGALLFFFQKGVLWQLVHSCARALFLWALSFESVLYMNMAPLTWINYNFPLSTHGKLMCSQLLSHTAIEWSTSFPERGLLFQSSLFKWAGWRKDVLQSNCTVPTQLQISVSQN